MKHIAILVLAASVLFGGTAQAQTAAQAAPADSMSAVAKNMEEIARLAADFGNQWAKEAPKMMEQVNQSCQNCHAIRNVQIQDFTGQMTKTFGNAADALSKHAAAQTATKPAKK